VGVTASSLTVTRDSVGAPAQRTDSPAHGQPIGHVVIQRLAFCRSGPCLSPCHITAAGAQRQPWRSITTAQDTALRSNHAGICSSPPQKKTGRTSGFKHPFSRVAAGALDLHYTTSLPLTRSASHGNPSPKQAQQ